MKVKVGTAWHSAETDKPLMVQLTAADLRNIANMVPGAKHYAVFHQDDVRSAEERLAWMGAQ